MEEVASASEQQSLRDTLGRRRAVLRESLRLKTLQQPPPPTEETQETSTTTFSTQDSGSLLADLRERRLKRRGQLPPLETSLTSTEPLPPKLEPFEPITGPSPSPPPPSTPPLGQPGSMTLSAAVRERLRHRLQQTQTDSAASPPSTEPPPGRRLRGLRDQPRLTRFDEPPQELQVSRDDLPTQPLLQASSSRWRALAGRMSEAVEKTMDQEAYDFFTGAVEDLEWPEAVSTHSVEGERGRREEGGGEEGEEMDTSALLEQQERVGGEEGEGGEEEEEEGEEEVPMITEHSESLLRPGHPVYTPQRERLARERVVHFVPSSLPAAAEQKTPGALPPRYLEEEGLYVGERPRVRWTNHVRTENRLLRRNDQGEGWFGEDGLLLCQPSPLRKIHTRPELLQHTGREEIAFRNARLETYSQKLIDRGSEGGGPYQLDVDVSSLHFTHHHLFSEEHVLASRLQQACSQLQGRGRESLVEYYSERLAGLKRAVSDLRQALQEADPSSPEGADLRHWLGEYSREVRVVRQKKKNEEAADYNLLKTILRLWQQLKGLRETQGYSSTTVWLSVRKVPTNAMEDEARLRREIEEELSERREVFAEGNEERVARYEAQLTQWKAHQKARRRALRRLSRQQEAPPPTPPPTDQSAGEGSQASLRASAEEEGASLVSVPPERPRPIPPSTFDEAEVRRELVEWNKRNRRTPGEPLLVPGLNHTHPLSQNCPRPEQQRREEARRVQFRVKVIFNGQEVSTTREGTLTADFSVHFGEIFNIRIVQWPESIKFQVYEVGLLSSTLLAEVYVPIPDPHQTTSSGPVLDPFQFSSNKPVSHTHAAVGSGEPLPSLDGVSILVTSGVLSVGVTWGEGEGGRVLCPPGFQQPLAFHSPRTDAVSCLGVAGIADLQQVKKWIDDSRLDPNDPRNAELLQLVHTIPNSADEAQYFQLLEVEESERFISDDHFESDRRFHMLQMRDQGHPGLKNKSIPLYAEGITESVWKSVCEYKPYADYDLPLSVFGDFHSARREERNKFLLDVRERVLSRVRSGKGELSLSDVVHSDIIPNISALKNTLVELVSPRRPLRPHRRGRRRPKPQNVHVSSANVVVRVVRAFNVPIRAHQDSVGTVRTRPISASHRPPLSLSLPPPQPHSSPFEPGSPEGLATAPAGLQTEALNLVCPYVEVAFGDVQKRSTTACGPNPFWNEELSLPFHPPHDDFSPLNLQRVTEVLQISLFDEVIIDILQDDRQRTTNVHHRLEKIWLGSFHLPFSTLHSRARIEGTFRLDIPLVHLGYEDNPTNQNTGFSELASSGHTHLQLFIALEPPLSVLPPIKDQFDSNEDLHLLQHASVWLRKLREGFPSRHYTATALDITGKHVFVTRFVHPQNPPPALAPGEDTNRTPQLMERLARYVSLIPFLPDTITFSGACDIWATSDQFLHMLGGDEEEHAVLLCNYFLHCGWRSWVLLGHAIPEGPTAYVLTENPLSGVGYWLWNPSTGRHFAQHEAYCPLTSVGCIFNEQNVWANIQDYEDPSRMVFDLNNGKHWRPLFPSDMQPLATVQQELIYTETDLRKVQELQERIERRVREHIMALRSRFITRWNRHCTRKLQAVLPRFEGDFSSPPLHEHRAELAEITASYKMTGFPIHLHYSDIRQIVTTVERTSIHLSENEQVEFALAVYVHPYPNDVLSVWTYIVSLVPK